MLEAITRSIVNLDIDAIDRFVNDALDAGCKPSDVLDAIKKGAEDAGRKFENNEYFLSELIMAGEVMKEAIKVLKPHLKYEVKGYGKVVLGTIEGDLHDIGKDIVATLLMSSGFQVFDLGIDVPPRKFAEKAKEINADVVGVSALLSVTVPRIRRVVEELRNSDIRHSVKVIAGGAALRKKYEKELGIDAAVNDAVEGIKIIKSWCKRNET